MNERDILIEYAELKKRKEDTENAAKEAALQFEVAQYRIINMLIDRNADSTGRYPGIGFASLSKPKIYASYDKNGEEKVFEFIEEAGEAELIKPTVHPASFSSFVGRCITEGREMPNEIEFYLKDGVRFYAR